MGPEIVTEITDVVRTGIAGYQAVSEARRARAAANDVDVADEALVVPGSSTAVPSETGPAVFHGRADIVADLAGQADTRGPGRPQLLVGAGGMGKTAIAKQVATKLGEMDRRRIWWIKASNEECLSAGLVTMAHDLGTSVAVQEEIRSHAVADLGGVIDRVWQLLEHEESRWLLVIDNADDPALLGPPDGTGWIRRTGQGLVLITTRNSDEGRWPEADLIPVGLLDPQAAARVLTDLAPAAGGRQAALALAERLGYLPLALRHAGMYLRREFLPWRTFDEYRHALDTKGAAVVMSASVRPDQRRVVTGTWELSLDALAAAGMPQARSLLWQLACYAPGSRIPEEMITAPRLRVAPRSHSLASAEERTEFCLEGLHALRSVNLIQRSDAPESLRAIEMHPVIAEITRAVMDADGARTGIDPSAVRECAADSLCAAVAILDAGNAEHWPYFRLLTPHVLDMLASTAPHLGLRHRGKLLNCIVRCITSYIWSRAELRAEQLATNALELAGRLGTEYQAEYLRLRHVHAWSVREQGNLRAAEKLFREILAAQSSLPNGPTRADTLRTKHDLAWTVGRSGRWREAEGQFREVLRDRRSRRRLRGENGDDPDILHSRCMLCWCVGRQGRWAEAERGYRLLAADRARLLGLDHADTLDTRENIGKALAWQGLWPAAEMEWREVAARRECVLRDKHPDTLRTRQLAAYAAGYLARAGRNRAGRAGRRKAIAELEQVLDVQTNIRGQDHKETQETLALLAALRGMRPPGLLWPEDLPQRPGASSADHNSGHDDDSAGKCEGPSSRGA